MCIVPCARKYTHIMAMHTTKTSKTSSAEGPTINSAHLVCVMVDYLRDAFQIKKNVKFETLAQKVGGGPAQIPNFFELLFGTLGRG